MQPECDTQSWAFKLESYSWADVKRCHRFAWRCFSDLRSAGFSSSQATIAILLQKRCIGAKSIVCIIPPVLILYLYHVCWLYATDTLDILYNFSSPISRSWKLPVCFVSFKTLWLGRAEIVHPIQNLHLWLVTLLQPFWEVLHSKAPSRLTFLLVESNV